MPRIRVGSLVLATYSFFCPFLLISQPHRPLILSLTILSCLQLLHGHPPPLLRAPLPGSSGINYLAGITCCRCQAFTIAAPFLLMLEASRAPSILQPINSVFGPAIHPFFDYSDWVYLELSPLLVMYVCMCV